LVCALRQRVTLLTQARDAGIMSDPHKSTKVAPPTGAGGGINGRQQVAHQPDTRYRLALAPTGTQIAWDIGATLQSRLRLLALVGAAGFASWFALGLLRWHAEWAADPWSSVTRPPGYGKALPLLCIEAAGALLLARRRLSIRSLRLLEWLIVGPVAVFFADKDCMNLLRVPLDELTWNVGTFANDAALGWVILMIGYGVLIPNTWRRCAAVVSLMALGALLPAAVVLVVKEMPAVPAVQYLGLKTMALAIAAVIIIYGSHRIQLLQERYQSTFIGGLTHAGAWEESPSAETQAAPEIAGRYRVEGEITRGGMGTIFKAYDADLGRDVAIKVLREKHRNNIELLHRFLEEARIAAQLQHPGIVPIYEVGQLADERPYFAMKLVKGETLERLLAKRHEPTQDLPHFLKIFELVCQTIAYTHTQGVIHRDLKPENIMVGPFREVMVMDWGIAKILNESGGIDVAKVTRGPAGPEKVGTDPGDGGGPGITAVGDTVQGAVLGTVAYMSPEQATGQIDRMDERTDVFSLGGILCVILTGQPPYPGKKGTQVYQRAQRAELTDAFRRLDACSADRQLVALAKRCLRPKPVDRPRHAGEVLRDLTAYLDTVFKQPERDLVRFFELSLDLFCIAGFDGYFGRVNSNFSRVLGYTDKELASRPFIEFVHPEDRDKTMAEMTKLSQGLPVVHFQNRYRDVQGNYRCFDWTAKSIPEEGVIFAVARDVTDQR
jgi:eukaryotic-like serine/threonine-protein kinase